MRDSGRGPIIHRFFDTSQFSPTGRYKALFRLPEPGDKGEIVIIDFGEGTETVVAEAYEFQHQLGANINWGENDDLGVFIMMLVQKYGNTLVLS